MDLVKVAQTYVEKMMAQVSGMKILLLDADTVGAVAWTRCPTSTSMSTSAPTI